MLMEDINPLQTCRMPPKDSGDICLNVRGRPTAEKTKKFSEQPKSIVSQLLNKMKNENHVSLTNLNIDQLIDIRTHSQNNEEITKTEDNCLYNCVCTICSHRSNDEKEHKKHVTIHKQFSCDYPNCLYRCKLSSNLIKHKRVHTDERPYLCDRCSFRSNFINSLKVHKRIHTSEKPYHCKHCSYRCNSSSNLKKHCLHRHSIKQNVQNPK